MTIISIIGIFILGFVGGSIYTWFCLRKYGREIVIEDIKEFINQYKQEVMTNISKVKEEIFKHKENSDKEETKINLVVTPYGCY